MGRWGDGEMRRWGDGEMRRWGDGEMSPSCTWSLLCPMPNALCSMIFSSYGLKADSAFVVQTELMG
ncbi:hypothetical protein VF10_32765 [Nostoc linckia z13]|nr:hypothetical protein VF10_32765 [Nostoc linckia z13]